MSVAIKIENLSKIYHLGQIGTGTFYNDLKRFSAKVRGKGDPFFKIGEDNKWLENQFIYSLKDINIEIQQGEALGIIGKNGAGKSTLLKIISQITAPTKGQVKIKGRIASLLEVGTGFHPELTGKENIYLNGAILGMKKNEITRKLDEIIEFSGVEQFINTPVKRYSSGMYVRLAFAVAAHLETEILIVDEVLAVGDLEFQKKCLGKMGEISRGEGKTVLFVSHNLDAVSSLCRKGLLLKNGEVEKLDTIQTVFKTYMNTLTFNFNASFESTSEFPHITNVELDSTALQKNSFKLSIAYKSSLKVGKIVPGFVLYNQLNVPIFGSNTRFHGSNFKQISDFEGVLTAEIEELNLHTGIYYINVWLGDQMVDYDEKTEVITFEYKSSNDYNQLPNPLEIGSYDQIVKWY